MQQGQKSRETEIANIQDRYATRLKARLSSPKVDVRSARDGMLDCFVATYFGGLQQGVSGYLGIDASEDQVANIAKTLFKKKLVKHGSTFEEPTVSSLDKVKQEVDKELHFHELPAELQGMHDQVCSLMLSKAEGTLPHSGSKGVVKEANAAQVAETQALETATSQRLERRDTKPSNIELNLRQALVSYLQETTDDVSAGESMANLRLRLEKVLKLVGTLEDFSQG